MQVIKKSRNAILSPKSLKITLVSDMLRHLAFDYVNIRYSSFLLPNNHFEDDVRCKEE